MRKMRPKRFEPIAETSSWIPLGTAAHVAGRSEHAVARAAEKGEIRVSTERGRTPLYARIDVMTWAGYFGANSP